MDLPRVVKWVAEGLVRMQPVCGLHLVLAKTNLPIGKRLRRFLVDEVLPQLVRTGRYAPEAGQRRAPQGKRDSAATG